MAVRRVMWKHFHILNGEVLDDQQLSTNEA